jgi:hypothetical protein
MKEKPEKQNEDKALRDLVLSAEQKGLSLQAIAVEARIGYQRLRRIVKYNIEPTYSEAISIQQAVQKLARKRAEGLASLVSV